MEKSGFFNSNNGDRKYKADFFAEYFSSFIGNGIFPNPSIGLQIIANGDMTVTVKPGKAWINGYYYNNDSDLILAIDVADGVLKRIDKIVMQFNTVNRTITAKVKKGTFASTPIAPSIQRDADVYELGIADIYIAAGATSISQANITDLRLDTTKCGIVHGVIEQVDTTTLWNQYQAKFEEDSQQFEADFNAWFATIQAALDGDTAGNLLNLINQNTTEINSVKSSLTEKANQTDLNITNNNVSALQIKLTDYNSYASSIDANGIYTVVDYKKSDATLYMKSTLSGGTSPQYTTDTWQFYDNTGTTIISTKIWTLTYDANGKITSKVVT